MRPLLLLLSCCLMLLVGGRVEAQSPFPIHLGSAGQEYGKCAAKAPDGCLLLGILFQNTVDFDPGPGTANLTYTDSVALGSGTQRFLRLKASQ